MRKLTSVILYFYLTKKIETNEKFVVTVVIRVITVSTGRVQTVTRVIVVKARIAGTELYRTKF